MKVEQVEVKVEQVEMKVKQGLVSAVACVRLVLPPSGSCWRGLLPSAVVFRSLCRAHCPHCHLVWQILPTLLPPPPIPPRRTFCDLASVPSMTPVQRRGTPLTSTSTSKRTLCGAHALQWSTLHVIMQPSY